MSPADPPRAAIVLFDGFELLDATGPYEVLAAPRGPGEPSAFEILSCAARPGPIASAAGLVCQASSSLTDASSADLVLVPGGAGVRSEETHREIVSWLTDLGDPGPFCTSVCTGAFLLARAGLTGGRRVTTHHLFRDELASRWADHAVVAERVVFDGPIATSAGVTAGIDLALSLVERWHGVEAQRFVRSWIEIA